MGDLWFWGGGLQAAGVEGQSFRFAEVALRWQFLAVEFEIQCAHVACSNDDFVLGANRLLRRCGQESAGNDFAIDGNGEPGVFARPDYQLKGRVCAGYELGLGGGRS